MKNLIVMIAIVAFSALAFAQDTTTTTPTGNTNTTTTPTGDTGTTTGDTAAHTAKKGGKMAKNKKNKKGKGKGKTEEAPAQ